MKRIIFLAIGVMVASAAGAQQKWTLRQCIDYAVENNVEIRRTALDVERTEVELNTARNSRLPGLDANASQNFGFGRTSVLYEDETTGATYSRYENTQVASTGFGIGMGMPLFQGFRINNQVKAGRIDFEAAVEGLERARQDLELSVAGYYLDVLFKKEILAVYREQTALARRQVENTSMMVEEGSVARSQLYEMQAQLAQSEVSEVNAANDLAVSLLNLSQALNLEHSSGFDIADVDISGLTPGALVALRSPDAIYETTVGTRPAVRQAELNLQSAEYGVKIAQGAFYPTLNLSANVNSDYQYVFGQSAQPDFAAQMRDKLREGVGINMSIPIFNRNATRNNVRTARIGVMNQSLVLEGIRQAFYKEVQQAWQRAVSAGARYEAATKALNASEEALRAMEIRYNSGKATVYEYSDANTKLVSSRSEQTQAKYDYLFSTKILDFYSGIEIDI